MTAQERTAALTVCGQARDTAEARELLLMLGLIDEATASAGQSADDEAAWWQELVDAGYAREVPA